MEFIDNPPFAPTLMESMRSIGYSLDTAAADIIDNSIAAGADQISLQMDRAGLYLAFLDNGCGMDEKEIDPAMQFGCNELGQCRDPKDLGRFGLGLKSASLSQCRKFTVVSKRNDQWVVRRWDLDEVIKQGKWILLGMKKEELDPQIFEPLIKQLDDFASGTLVVWENLDRLKPQVGDDADFWDDKLEKLVDHLSLVFHRYLSPGEADKELAKITIKVRTRTLKANDPFLEGRSSKLMDKEVIKLDGKRVEVQAYVLPRIEDLTSSELKQLGGESKLDRTQGFYIYRNKRLLIYGTWYGYLESERCNKRLRIKVDLPNTLDEKWTLDVKKSRASPPRQVRPILSKLAKLAADKSRIKGASSGRGSKLTEDSIWKRTESSNNRICYEVDRQAEQVKKLFDLSPEARKCTQKLLDKIENTLPLNLIDNEEKPKRREMP